MGTTIENRVQLIGFLGTEIEVRQYAEGKKLARFSLATHETRRGDEGRKEYITTWHNLIAWGKDAEKIAKVFTKGQRMYVEGKLSYREHTSVDGTRRNTTEIIVTDFKKLEASDKF